MRSFRSPCSAFSFPMLRRFRTEKPTTCAVTGIPLGRSFFVAATDLFSNPEMIAGKLVDRPVLRITRVGGGRNSRVFRVETADHVYALKQYPPRKDDQRDRLAVETKALDWMEKHGLTTVPRVIAKDTDSNSAL